MGSDLHFLLRPDPSARHFSQPPAENRSTHIYRRLPPSHTPTALRPRALWGCGKHPSALARRPPRGIYRAETPRRGEPKFSISAPLPLCARFGSHSHFSPGLQNGPPSPKPVNSFPHAHRTKSVNAHPHTPFPTPTALCHKARGYAVSGVTPGPGHIAFPTPQGVVPFVPAGGCGKQGRNEIVFAGAEEESARNVCPIPTQDPHITYHPFEPSAQPRWGC